MKISDVDQVLSLIRALLLEKKIILIKEDVADAAIPMQTLVALLAPFKWNYTLITDLPREMIGALESPQPFFIAIRKQVWNSLCQVQMMDNVKEENFVIVDLDENKSRGLTDIYDRSSSTLANISLQQVFKTKY